jgi:hypothetical protein
MLLTIQAHAKSINEPQIISRWLVKLTQKQHLLQFILYMKHDNVIIYNACMWNWSKNAICDDVVFIISCIHEALHDEIKWCTIDTPPSSLMDSTGSSKVKIVEGEGIGVRSLAYNTSGVEGHAGAMGWD